jgi:RNA polymerase sigma factor (sigma-70 family)
MTSTIIEMVTEPEVAADDAATPGTSTLSAAPAERSDLVDLVRRASAGDQTAWDSLVERFAGTVWAIARAHRLDDATAADVSQTTWLRLVEHLDRIEQPERIGAWLATTARRESLRVIRMAGRQVPTGEDFDLIQAPFADAPDSPVLTTERDQVLAQLVSQLPCRCRLILHLLSADTPLSYKELSQALEMPIGSIGPTRARCLEHLRRIGARAGIVLSDALL